MAHTQTAVRPVVRGAAAAIGVVAAAAALPWLVHLGHLPGQVLLPMHLSTMLAGAALGPLGGLVAGLLAPTASFLLTGLPPAPIVPLMVIEVGAYGLVTGWLAHRTRLPGLAVAAAAALAGRAVLLLAVAALGSTFGITAPPLAFVAGALKLGWPGVAIQLAVLGWATRRLAR